MPLIDKTASGVKWSSISQIGRQLMQLVTTIILTRLLSPSDFGLVGMAMVVTGFVALFHDFGTSATVIQKKVASEVFLSSIFWVNAAFGLLAMVIIFAFAPLAANLYHEPRVSLILKLLSLSFLISGLSIVQQAILERELAFKKLARVEMVAGVSSSFVCIGAALLGAEVWSLVYQTLMSVTVTTVLLWTSSDWRPKAVFHWGEVRSVRSYSLNLTGFYIFNYFARNADTVLIGRFLGAQNLGYYMMAYRIMFYPIQTISAVIGRVMFPVYSQIQEDEARFRRIYLKVIGAIGLITFPMMMGVWGLAQTLVLTLFGSQWKPVMILAPVGLIQSIVTTVGTIYQAKGRTDWMFRLGVATGLIAVLAFVIGLQWGIVGVAGAYTIATILCLYPNFTVPFKLINLKMQDLGDTLWRPFLGSLMMLGGILGLKYAFPPGLTSGKILCILVPVGIIIYLAASWWMNREQAEEFLHVAGIH
jgi:PST family polysaccharide transporter